MSQDQLSSSAPPTRPIPKPRPNLTRSRAQSDPNPPVSALEGKHKPPVHSSSADELTKQTAAHTHTASTIQPRPRPNYSRPSSYNTQGSAESGVSASTASSKQLSFDSIAEDPEELDLYSDDTNASTHPNTMQRPSSTSQGESISQISISRMSSNAGRGWGLTEGEELEEMRRRKVALEREITNLTTTVNQLKHDEKTWGRRQLSLEQREYAVVERERKLKLAEEELESKKGDQEYQLNQERSRLQAWDDMLVMRKKNLVAEEFELRNSMSATAAESSAQVAQLADRMYAVQQRELELMKNQQSLDSWARQIQQDNAAIERRWYDLRQREAELEERNRVLHYQQQARFQYSSDVPDVSPTHAGFVSPAHAGFVPQGHSQPGTESSDFWAGPERPRERSVSSRSSVSSSCGGDVSGIAMTSTPRKSTSIDVDAELAASMAETPHERVPVDIEQINKDAQLARQLQEQDLQEQGQQGRKVSVDQDHELAVQLQQEQLAGSNLSTTNDFGGGSGEETVKEALQKAITMVHDRKEQEKQDFLLAKHIQTAGEASTNGSGAEELNDLG